MSSFDNSDFFGFSDMMGKEGEMMPVISTETEDDIENEEIEEQLPILPLRNAVLFPGVVTPITVGREKSLNLIKQVNNGNKTLGAIAQRDDKVDDPSIDDFYEYGTVARIIKMLNMPDGSTTVIIQGRRRFKLTGIVSNDPYHIGDIEAISNAEPPYDQKEFDALISSIKDMAYQIIQKSPNIPMEASFTLENIESPKYLVNFICNNLSAEVDQKQGLLETDNIQRRAQNALELLSKEMQMVDLKHKIQNKVKSDLDKQQRDYFLNQQLKTIKEELGDNTQ